MKRNSILYLAGFRAVWTVMWFVLIRNRLIRRRECNSDAEVGPQNSDQARSLVCLSQLESFCLPSRDWLTLG